MIKLNLKKGDTVKVLAGKDRGKTGKIIETDPQLGKVVVEGQNIAIRFSRPKRQGETGQRIELPAALFASKVMLICPACGKSTRVAHEKNESGNFRKCKECGKLIN